MKVQQLLLMTVTIDITSQDDGFNAASASAGRKVTPEQKEGKGQWKMIRNCYLTISGGKINVNATGDGLDSNGSVYISGGEIYVSGPTANNNGGLDYNGTGRISPAGQSLWQEAQAWHKDFQIHQLNTPCLIISRLSVQ